MRKSQTIDLREIRSFADGAIRFALLPREQLTASDWIGRYFKHGPNSESFDFERFPWLREPLDAITDVRSHDCIRHLDRGVLSCLR